MSILADDAVRRYLELPYRITLTRDGADDERPWRAGIEELAGCEVRAGTASDAAARIPAALAEWVAAAQAEGREVPEPRETRAYSGKLLLRMPQSLHGELAQAAERDQVSLNAYLNGLLAAAMQWGRPDDAAPANGDRAADGLWDDEPGEDPEAVPRLQRLLVIALAANLAVIAVAAAIAVVLLLSS